MQAPTSQNPSNVLVVGASGMVGEKIVHELTCGSQKDLFKVTAAVPKGETKSKLHECPCNVVECRYCDFFKKLISNECRYS